MAEREKGEFYDYCYLGYVVWGMDEKWLDAFVEAGMIYPEDKIEIIAARK